MGPTGVGKTAVALALGRELPIEVVSVDSRQVYRRMDIGTGKATREERARVRHHLVDVVEPDERYDAARFVRDAESAIAAIRARGRWPVLVGGTGFYFRALVRGLGSRPPGDPERRHRLVEEAGPSPGPALHRRLAQVDPGAARRLAPTDLVRVTRALEVALLRGKAEDPGEARAWLTAAPRHATIAVALTMDREALYGALDARVDRMLASGFLDEVAGLVEAGFGIDLPAMQGIGYRHLVPVVAGRARLEAAAAAMKRDTRRYAKRQGTWFAREPDLRWITIGRHGIEPAVVAIKNLIEQTLGFH